MRLRTAKRQMNFEVARIRADRVFAEMSLKGVNATAAKQSSKDVVNRVAGMIKPWLDQPAEGEDDLDLVARWYIINAPGKLQELGVDFAALEPLLG